MPAAISSLLRGAIVLATLAAGGGTAAPQYPGASWEWMPRPASPAFRDRDAALTATLRAGDTSAVVVVVGGRIAYAYGDVAEVSYLASARKSVVAMLYGPQVARGTIALSSTLVALGVDDRGGLLPREREATVADLLAARSGVYHRAANLGDASDRAPARGSVQPGSYFLYNNWDFNALEGILERRTGRSVYALIGEDLAGPIGMEDWDRRPDAYAAYVRNDTGASDFPAHHIPMSARDMARLGHLMLRGGRWRDGQVLDDAWVRRITAISTPADEVARTWPFVDGLGYGWLWWTLDGARFRGTPLEGAYTASGAAGQFITVVPRLDAVIVHKTVAPSARNVPADVYFAAILPRAAALAAAVPTPATGSAP